MRKTFIFFALIAFALFSFCSGALAGQPRYRQAAFLIGHNEYFVKTEYPREERNRNEEAFRPMDAAPFVENGRTYVPVRYLALALGIRPEDIGWDEKTETVMLTLGDVQNFWISAWVWYSDSKGKFPENFTIDDLLKILKNIRIPGLTKEDIIEWRIGEDSDGQHVEGKYRVPPVVHLKLVIGSKILYVNGQPKQMDVAPLVRGGRTYLPARWVAEAFGYEVKWDEKTQAVLVGPPGNVPEPPKPPARNLGENGPIDLTAAKNGILGVPANAVAPPSKWGFEPKICRIEFEAGSSYAKIWPAVPEVMELQKKIKEKRSDLITQWINWQHQNNYPRDPSTGKLIEFEDWLKDYPNSEYTDLLTRFYGYAKTVDLEKEAVYVTNKQGILDASKMVYPNWPTDKTIVWNDVSSDAGFCALYVPFIPVAEAFGVPRGNIVWDGEHLGIWGFYGHVEDYKILTVGSKNGVCKGYEDNFTKHLDEAWEANDLLDYPLFVKDGVPMVGIGTVSDIWLLFASRTEPAVVDGHGGGHLDAKTGKAHTEIDYKPSETQ